MPRKRTDREPAKSMQRYHSNTQHQVRWCRARGHLWIERNGVILCKRCSAVFD